MSTPTVSAHRRSTEAWALFWRIFIADKPRRMATLTSSASRLMQAMALDARSTPASRCR